MTPFEKATELKFKYWNNVDVSPKQAIQCALIAVDEVINEYESNICNSGYDYDFERWDMQRDYWTEVKQELEKL